MKDQWWAPAPESDLLLQLVPRERESVGIPMTLVIAERLRTRLDKLLFDQWYGERSSLESQGPVSLLHRAKRLPWWCLCATWATLEDRDLNNRAMLIFAHVTFNGAR
jgi:hypothetical protein